MKPFLYICLLCIVISCKPGKKESDGAAIKDTAATNLQPVDTAPKPTIPAGKIDIESFGYIKIGQPVTETIKALGEPDNKTKPEEWGADGLLHEYWTWKSKGLELNIASEKNKPASATIFSINAEAPCSLKTRAGMGIGNSYNEIKKAYSKDISEADSNTEQVLVGSVYGGIIFTLTNGKVSHVFLGAAAE